MQIKKGFYIFNYNPTYSSSVGILLNANIKIFNAGGGQTASNLYMTSNVLSFNIPVSTTNTMYDFNTQKWTQIPYRFIEILEDTNISDEQYDYLINNGTFINDSQNISLNNGEYILSAGMFSSFTAFTFSENVDFIINDTITASQINVEAFKTTFTSAMGTETVYDYGTFDSSLSPIKFYTNPTVSTLCAVWVCYVAIYSINPTNVSSVLTFNAVTEGYTVYFNANEGSVSPAQIDNITKLPTTLPIPTRVNYTFNGWFSGLNQYRGGETLTGDLFLKAQWTRNYYTVTYYSNGGDSIPPLENATELPTPLPQPSRLLYNFLGWYYDSTFNNEANAGDILYSNVSLYAKWESLIYVITFDSVGGSLIPPIEASIIPSNLPTPVKQGYTFIAWYYDSAYINIVKVNDVVDSDITIYAKWEENEEYDIDKLNVVLYQYSSERNVVNKSPYLKMINKISGVVRGEIDLLNPDITIELSTPPLFNYVYIPNFERYYYVTGIKCMSKNIYVISLKVDVLYTYKNTIEIQNAFIERNEFDYNADMVDTLVYSTLQENEVDTVYFPTDVGDATTYEGSIVLTVVKA